MGLFKLVNFRRRTLNIATRWGALRLQQFEAIRANIENKLPGSIPRQIVLGGAADFALRAYQLNTFVVFSIDRLYFPQADFKLFAEHLSFAVCDEDSRIEVIVESYCKQFAEFTGSALRVHTDEAWAEHNVLVSRPIAAWILEEAEACGGTVDPRLQSVALVVVGRLVPLLAINTAMVIVDEFGDEKTFRELYSEFDTVRAAVERHLRAEPVMLL